MIELSSINRTVKIDAGELVGLEVDGHEYIHQKGSPGWRNSDTEMFPIIGPTTGADFKVRTPNGSATQDQHGLLRELDYELEYRSKDAASFQKKYTAGTKIPNSKYPEKSTVKELYWPYDFKFQKIFRITDKGLEITFKISGEEGMPFMLGYHPAFKLHSKNPVIQTGDRSIFIPEIIKVGHKAMEISGRHSILLKDKKELKLQTEGFKGFMLWTEVANMVCIEPITFYPYAVDPKNLHEGFMYLNKNEETYKVNILVD